MRWVSVELDQDGNGEADHVWRFGLVGSRLSQTYEGEDSSRPDGRWLLTAPCILPAGTQAWHPDL